MQTPAQAKEQRGHCMLSDVRPDMKLDGVAYIYNPGMVIPGINRHSAMDPTYNSI